jgi:hypothetical protein
MSFDVVTTSGQSRSFQSAIPLRTATVAIAGFASGRMTCQ